MSTLTVSAQCSARLAAVEAAGKRVAPTWPLDQLIAVNPLWELRDQSFTAAAARLEALGRMHCLMPADYYVRQWQRSRITDAHLQLAAAEFGVEQDSASLLQALKQPGAEAHWHNVSDLLDSTRDRQHQMAWRDEISHQISQFCAFLSAAGPSVGTQPVPELGKADPRRPWYCHSDGRTRADQSLP